MNEQQAQGEKVYEVVNTETANHSDFLWNDLMDAVLSGRQDIDIADFQKRLKLPHDWTWGDFGPKDYAAVVAAIRAGLR